MTTRATTRIWDLPTRLFHWALAACVSGLLATGWLGGGLMDWHFRLGYVTLALLGFRLVWGFVGGRWSRFSSFLYSPASVVRYLKGRSDGVHEAGHTPTGALSVFALLLVVLLQVLTGMTSDDAITFTGPLAPLVSGDVVALATDYHKQVGHWIVLALVVLHLLAIVFYAVVKRRNLTAAMITGDKAVDAGIAGSRDDGGRRLLALVIFGLCLAAVGALLKWTGVY